MWPKAFAQLIELAPHISRLLPVADRFLQSRTATDDSARRNVDAVAEELRGDLGQVAAAHAGLGKQIAALGEAIAIVGGNVAAAKASAESAEARVGGMDTRLAAIETRLAGLDTQIERVSERVRLGPIVLLLVLTNLILLACVITLLVHRR